MTMQPETGRSRLTDDALIAAGEKIVADLGTLERKVNRDLWRVASLFGIPFFVYLAPLIYTSLGELRMPGLVALASALAMVFIALMGLPHWRRRPGAR